MDGVNPAKHSIGCARYILRQNVPLTTLYEFQP
jgi:hypothetical protein